MEKKSENLILFFLVIFAVYCSLTLGMSWDEPYHYEDGLNRLRYSLSLGRYEYHDFLHLRYYTGFYDTLSAFVSQVFPKKHEVHIHHLINLFFSLLTIFGISKIAGRLFNKKVGKIVFLISFLNPIFFGHMSINPKDTIIAFSNVWATYFIIRYLQTQQINIKRKYFSTLVGLTLGFGIGIRILFLGTLLPILILTILDIFFLKKLTNEKFSLIKFFNDLFKVLLIAYVMMIIFWPSTHDNIFTLPFKLFFDSLNDLSQGTDWGLMNGKFYRTYETPKTYIIINLFYKLPEFVLLSYIIFVYLFFNDKNFFLTHFKFVKTKLSYLLFIIVFSIVMASLMALKIFDGLRYFLFLMPYLSIIPAIAIYYLIYNIKLNIHKFYLISILALFIYYLFNFFSLTPYHYTYLNILNGNFSDASKRFENDYWGISLKELVSKIEMSKHFNSNNYFKIAYCGINNDTINYYLRRIENFKYIETPNDEDYDYIIMTNRVSGKDQTCFDSYKGKDILSVKRNGLILSRIRENTGP
jgi:hypothetical protein